MKITVAKRVSKKGNTYYIMEAEGDCGRVAITFDKHTIMEVLPRGIDIRDLDEAGILIGEIYDA